MGTTTNNGWPTPVATDLVKDGWEAIKDLGDAIDTTLGVYAPSTPGLTLINTTSFSGVSSIALPLNTFTSTYDNYRLLYFVTPSTGNNLTVRMRAAGVDNSGSNYRSQQGVFGGSTAAAARNDTTAFNMNYDSLVSNNSIIAFEFFRPNSTDATKLMQGQISFESATTFTSGRITSSTQFDSVNLICSTGTITGTVYAYAYNK
jgi:hypothetical protein